MNESDKRTEELDESRRFHPLPRAARLAGIDKNPSTLWRWHRKGINGVRLKAFRAGRGLVTTVENIHLFMDELTEADNANCAPLSDSHQVAEAELDRLGI